MVISLRASFSYGDIGERLGMAARRVVSGTVTGCNRIGEQDH